VREFAQEDNILQSSKTRKLFLSCSKEGRKTMATNVHWISLGMVILAAATSLADDAAPKAESAAQAAKALEIIQSDAPAEDKAIPCKILAIYGGKEAVPALAALLPDPELSSWARIALEAIPGPEADAALRNALGKVRGRQLIGVVNSLGVRRDAKAVDALVDVMRQEDVEVASAAACALGHIGGDPAAKALSARPSPKAASFAPRRRPPRSTPLARCGCTTWSVRPTCRRSESSKRPAGPSSRGRPTAFRSWSSSYGPPTRTRSISG
jgi:hypothetical protein